MGMGNQGGFLGTIFWIVISVVIFCVIYSLWFNPSFTGEVVSNIKSSISSAKVDVQGKVQSKIEQDSSITSCLDEIKEKVRIAEAKSPVPSNIYVKEYRKFTNTQDALDYLEEWGFMPKLLEPYALFPELFEENETCVSCPTCIKGEFCFAGGYNPAEYNDVIIALTRFDYSFEGSTAGSLQPIICINGSMVESSEKKFRSTLF